MDKQLHVGVACGGTGGHIFPGLATASVLREHGHRVTLWMTGRDIEGTALDGWEGSVQTVPARGLAGGFSLGKISALFRLLQARATCRRRMEQDLPQAVLAMGSYASAGPVGAAVSLRVPVVLHEANVLPGKAVSFFARRAAAVAGSFEETRFYLKRKNIRITGMPLRQDLRDGLEGPRLDGLVDGAFTVLVMGGSRGARVLNELVTEALGETHQQSPDLQVIHLSGADDRDRVEAAYTRYGIRARVLSFVQDMAAVYRSADFAVCRSGASSCAELRAFRLPSLLVPYPYAVRDHQMANARAMEKSGAADVVPEKDLTVPWLVDYLAGCMYNPQRLERMQKAAQTESDAPAAELLAALVEEVARGSRE